jgi:hypothetical protein
LVEQLQFSLFKRNVEEDIGYNCGCDTIYHMLDDTTMQEIKHERAFRTILQDRINAGAVQVNFRILGRSGLRDGREASSLPRSRSTTSVSSESLHSAEA